MKTKLIILMLVMCLGNLLFAQSDKASITGEVKDATGAMVPGVSVTAINEDTNIQTTATTNNLGLYSILNLPIGHYRVTFTRDGFTTYRRQGITLLVSQVAQINVILQVGAAKEVLSVTEEAPLLQTQSAAVTSNLTNDVVSELPLNVQGGRNLSAFMFNYVPGVEGSDYDSHISGSLSKSKEVMIDGTSAVAQIGGYLSESAPPMEAVQEFQVETTGIRADEGRSGGGVFRYSMKSGTNKWHGSGFLFMHNELFDATSYNSKYQLPGCLDEAGGDSGRIATCKSMYSRPEDRLYDYGGSFGGPIRKDKTFFYFGWERYTFMNTAPGGLGSTVPTAAMLNGDFSALLDKSTVLGTDGAGNTVYKGAIIDPTTGNAFVGNIIPADRISNISKQIVALYQKYYQPVASGLYNNNAMPASNPATWYQSNQYSIKIDHSLSDRHKLAGSFIYAYIPRLLSDQGGIWSPGSADGGPMANAYDHNTTAPAIRLSDSFTINPTLLNVFNITFNRFHNPSFARSQKDNWSSTLGLGDFGAGNFPIIKFQGVNSDQHRYVGNTAIDETQLGSQFNDFYTANDYIFNDSLSWVKGRHTYKFGAEVRIMQFNNQGDYGVPTFIFDPAQTAGAYGGNAGFGFASFLLGDVNQASVSEPNNMYGRRKSMSLYAQDDIKVNSRLTLNLDLRWDFNGRYHEKYGRWSNFNTQEVNPVTGRLGTLDFANGGGDSFEKRQYWTNFSPHVGASYQITPKTVARASFGIFYVPLNLNTWGAIPYGFNPGFVLNNQVLTPFNWDNGYPGQAVDIGKDPNFTKWGMVSVDPRELELGNTQQWMVGVQRELTNDLRLDVSFIQSHSYHLESGYVAANQPKLSDYTNLVQSGQQWATVTEPGFTGPGWASVAPFPSVAATWGPLFYVGSPLGNSDYQSLQFNITKRASHGLSLQASYNLSSSHGDTDTSFEELWSAGPIQDVYDLQHERHVISSFDQTHVVKGYINYDLPFGRGKALLNTAGKGLDAVVGGWTLTSGFHYNTGTPMSIGANVWYPGINNVRPNLDPNCDLNVNTGAGVGQTYFNAACFSQPANGEFGNAPTYLSQLRNPGLATEDIGVNKALAFGEDGHYKLSLRFQLFNAFNRHGFSGPNTNLGAQDANGNNLFGVVTTDKLNGTPGPRVGQLGIRFSF